jgi:hypothetical protein
MNINLRTRVLRISSSIIIIIIMLYRINERRCVYLKYTLLVVWFSLDDTEMAVKNIQHAYNPLVYVGISVPDVDALKKNLVRL